MPETDQGVTDFVLAGDVPLTLAQQRLADVPRHHPRRGRFRRPHRCQAMLLGLGLRVEQLEAPVNSFSGSRRMRLQLPRALMCPVDDKPGSRPSPTTVNGRSEPLATS